MNDHRDYFSWGSVSHWSGDTASAPSSCDRIDIEVGSGLSKHTISLSPSNRAMIDTIKGALDLAVETGGHIARTEIRKALGVRDTRP